MSPQIGPDPALKSCARDVHGRPTAGFPRRRTDSARQITDRGELAQSRAGSGALFAEALAHADDCVVELAEVVFDGGADHLTRRHDVAVSKMVAHPSDPLPRDVWLGVAKVVAERLDGFADLDEADPYGVEDKVIVEATAQNVRPDLRDGHGDVIQAVGVEAGHSAMRSSSTRVRAADFRSAVPTTSTSTPKISVSSSCNLKISNRLMPAEKSTKRSRSLVLLSSPRATLPKIRGVAHPEAGKHIEKLGAVRENASAHGSRQGTRDGRHDVGHGSIVAASDAPNGRERPTVDRAVGRHLLRTAQPYVGTTARSRRQGRADCPDTERLTLMVGRLLAVRCD